MVETGPSAFGRGYRYSRVAYLFSATNRRTLLRAAAHGKISAEHDGGYAPEFRMFLKSLGPGLITRGADDDPSGIGTQSQVGV